MKISLNILAFFLLSSALFCTHGLGLEQALANIDTPQSLLLQTQEAVQANKMQEALTLGRQAAQLAQDQENKNLEVKAREFLVELLRGPGLVNHMTFYREQLDRLEALYVSDGPPFTEAKTLLHLFQAELAFILNLPSDVNLHAQKAQAGAEALHNQEFLRTAQILQGLANFQSVLLEQRSADLLGILPGLPAFVSSSYKQAQQLLHLGLKGLIHSKFKNLEFSVQLALLSIAIQEGDLELAQQILDRSPDIPSMPPLVRAIRLYTLATVQLGKNQVEEAKLLAKQAHDILESENNAQAKSQIYWAIAIPLSIMVGQLEQAKQMFQWSLNTLQDNPAVIQLLFLSLQAEIIPTLERNGLSQLGAEFLVQVLAIPAIYDSPEMAYKIFPALGRFYADLGDEKRLDNLLGKVLEQHNTHPAWNVLQALNFSFAEILKIKDVELTKRLYRIAIQNSFQGKENQPFWPYFFHALRKTMNLALTIGDYQDVVDFALLGLTPLSYEMIGESAAQKEAAIWFLVDAGEILQKIGRIDLVVDAIELAIARQSHAPPGWANRIALSSANLFALLGDYENARAHLFIGLKMPFSGRGIEEKAAEYWLQLSKVQYELGDYFRAEKSLRACIDRATALWIQPIIEGECRVHLGYFLATRTSGEEGWDEWFKGIQLLAPNLDKTLEVLGHTAQETIRESREDQESIDLHLESVKIGLDTLSLLPSTVRTQTMYALLLSLRALLKKFRGQELPYSELTSLESLLAALIHEPYISQQDYVALMFTVRNLRDTGATSLTIPLLENITQRLEYVRNVTKDPRTQLFLGSAIEHVFDIYTNILLQSSQPDLDQSRREALIISDANRGRTVLRSLNLTKNAEDKADLSQSVLEQTRSKLEGVLREARAGIPRRPSAFLTEEWVNFLTLKTEIDGEQDNVENMEAKPDERPQQRPIPRVDIEAIQRQLDLTTVVIVYHFTDDLTGAWLVTNKRLDWVPLEGWNTVQETILRFRTEVLTKELSWKSRITKAGKQAYSTLLAPLLQLVPHATHLVIIPDRSAFVIPFEAMVIAEGQDEGKYLIEKFDISYQFSLELLRHLGEEKKIPRPQTNSILLVGNPDFEEVNRAMPTKLVPLPGTQYELETIRQVIGSENVHLYLGAQATRAQLTQGMNKAGIVHVATHGIVNEYRPWESFLAFSGAEGKLPLTEISKLKTSANLVILSACDTGRGRILEGEGVWGFQAQFLAAGAKNVIASLWRVADDSTAHFMAEFYRHLTKKTTSYASALRQSKLDLMANEQWRHQYFWAPFILYGTP